MKRISLFLLVGLLSYACSSDKKMDEREIYTFLELCYEDYFKNYDVEILDLLDEFEQKLVSEGHLKDTTGDSYKKLLKTLSQDNYFSSTENIAAMNDIVLFKNPMSIYECAEMAYGIDSTTISQTHFSSINRNIADYIENNEEISIHYFFDTYRTKLRKEEIKLPYIKQTIQVLLYRWYYQSGQIQGERQ